MPLTGAGSSTSTLSVEISTIVSSRSMKSPTFACHSRIVPSVTDSPAPGVTMSTVSPTPEGSGAASSAAGAAGAPLAAAAWPLATGSLEAGWPFVPTPLSLVAAPPAGWGPGAPPLVLISASTSPTLTVSPSAKKSLTIVPLTVAGHLGVHLVGGDLDQRLVGRDRVALLLMPFENRAFGHRFAHRGHRDLNRCGRGHFALSL